MARRSSRRGASSSSKPTRSHLHRGDEGRSKVDGEIEKQKQRSAARGKGKVFRFFVPVGETKEFVILDDKPDCFMYEHTIPDPTTGKWNNNQGCVKEYDSCALCDEYGESAYVMFLSIIDFTEFKDKNDKVHKFSRKLMAIKPSQQKKFTRFYNKEGSLRGAVFEANRDGPKDAAIGNDLDFIEWMEEDELTTHYIRKWTDRDGKKHEENQSEPFEYEEIFEAPDAEKFRAMTGAAAPLGSKAQQDEDSDDDDGWDDDDDDEDWDKDDAKFDDTEDDDGDDDDDDDDDEEEPKPRRGRGSRSSKRGGSKKSKPSRRSRKPADDDEDAGDDDAEDEPPKSRRGSGRKRGGSRSRR